MRTVRALTTTLAFLTLLPAIGAAQSEKPFKDAWFWGVKGGGFVYGDQSAGTASTYKQAPTAGIDWMITRTHGGLYVSYTQGFLTAKQYVTATAEDTVPREVDLKGLRRFDAAAMVFPGDNPRIRPYAGLGFTMLQVATASPQGTFQSMSDYDATVSLIQDNRTGFSPLVIVGSQFRLNTVWLFVQGTASPAQQNMFLYNQRAWHMGYDIGLRYNIGSSIEQD
jgi:hypothetical protein